MLDSSDTKAEVDGNISKTEVENGHISEPTKEEMKIEKEKSEAEPMQVVGTEEIKTMDSKMNSLMFIEYLTYVSCDVTNLGRGSGSLKVFKRQIYCIRWDSQD